MALIDCVTWTPQENSEIFAYRYPKTNLSTYTQLVVHESQEAFLFVEGELAGKFGPGRYTLDTKNLPILRHLYGFPFGGKNPFTAEVWFVSKLHLYNLTWDIKNISIHDIDYDTYIPLAANGQYGIRVADGEKFLIKAVGTKQTFTQRDMTSQFEGEFNTKAKSAITQFLGMNKIGFKGISAHLDSISEYLKDKMVPFWASLGIELTKFYVSTIEIDDSSEGRRIKEAINQQSAMSITGHTWQQEQAFNTANNAIDGFGNGNMGLLGGLMAMNMMNSNGGGMGSGMMNPNYNQPRFNNSNNVNNANMGGGQNQQMNNQVKMVYCSNCSKKYSSSMNFCPHCGDLYNPCPNCGTDNDTKAKRCISCGMQLQGETTLCPSCGAQVSASSPFCGNCGQKLSSGNSDVCSRCGTPFKPNSKFCSVCGNKR